MATVTADVALLHPHLPELALPDYAAAATEAAVRAHVAAAFGALRTRIALSVQAACAAIDRAGAGEGGRGGGEVVPLGAAYTCCFDALHRGVTSLLQVTRGPSGGCCCCGCIAASMPVVWCRIP